MRILYIDCDSLRPDHLGCYGYNRNTSPTIDQLATDSRRYTNYYTSDAPCGPSRTATFFGRFGFHTGVVNHGGTNADPRPQGSDRDVSNIGKHKSWMTALRETGYRTALVSPFPQRHAAFHVLDGFDEWHDTGGGGTERADQVYMVANEWLEDHATDEDWYLHVNFWDPHAHYDTPLEYGNPFEDDSTPEWMTEERIHAHYESYGPHSAQDLHHGYLYGRGPPDDVPRVPDKIASKEDFRRWIDGYDVGIRYMDEYIGQLIDQLQEAGVYENTFVILSADHGENQGELNVYGDHQTADHWTCRVPLIMNGPTVEPGVDDGFFYNIDLPPTITELVGGEIPDGWDGRSFVESVTDGHDIGRDYLVISQGAWACQRGVRFDDWLLIRTYHDGFKDFAPVELYDLGSDPHETENLAQERPESVREGLSLLTEWRGRRMTEAAIGTNGAIAESPRNLTDPLFRVMQEGGPEYTRDALEAYTDRLRATGREEHARNLEESLGVVSTDITEYIRGESS